MKYVRYSIITTSLRISQSPSDFIFLPAQLITVIRNIKNAVENKLESKLFHKRKSSIFQDFKIFLKARIQFHIYYDNYIIERRKIKVL